MKQLLLTLIIFFVAINLQAQQKPVPSPKNNTNHIAPDYCFVQAKVIRIKKRAKTTCKTVPCIAKIKILKIKGYGSSFPVKFHPNQKLTVQFAYSLNRIKDGNTELPGLKKRDRFEARIKAKPVMNTNSNEFVIYLYDPL